MWLWILICFIYELFITPELLSQRMALKWEEHMTVATGTSIGLVHRHKRYSYLLSSRHGIVYINIKADVWSDIFVVWVIFECHYELLHVTFINVSMAKVFISLLTTQAPFHYTLLGLQVRKRSICRSREHQNIFCKPLFFSLWHTKRQ